MVITASGSWWAAISPGPARWRSRVRGWQWHQWILSLPVTFILLTGGINLPSLGITWNFAPLVENNLWAASCC